MSPTLEDLFERYRSRGDLDALGEVFDRTAPALVRVAQHLRGRQDAEDIVQSTYLRAIEAADTWDGRRPLTPWLIGVLGNQARRRRVRGRRRPDPARLASPGRSTDPLSTARGRELGEAVEATIADLPAQYQPVLRLHLLDGREPAEIAVALARQPGTVRSQLARGLRTLRRLLPAGFAAGAAGATGATRSQADTVLPAMRATILAHAGSGTMALVGTTGALVIGGLAMQKLGLFAMVAGMLVIWFAWRAGDPVSSGGPSSTDGGATVEATGTDTGTDTDSRTVSLAAGPERVVLPPAASPAAAAVDAAVPGETGRLRIRATWSSDGVPAVGVPAVGVPIFVAADRVGNRPFARRQATTDASGIARFTGLPAGRFIVEGGRSEYESDARIDVSPGIEATLEISFAGVTVRGRVVDPEHRPVFGARIVVAAGRSRELASAAADGTFELRGLHPDVRIGARATGYAPSPMNRVPPAHNGRPGELQIVLPGPGGRLLCTVLGPRGEPLPDALVSVGAGHWRARPRASTVGEWQATTDQAGCVQFDGVGRGELDILAWAAGRSPWRGTAVVTSGDNELEIRLQDGAVLHGLVRDTAGRPLAGYEVAIGRAPCAAFQEFGAFAFQHRRTDAAGAYRIDGIPAGIIAARVSGGGVVATRDLTAPPGGVVRWDPELEVAAGFPGRVVGPVGRGLRAMVEGGSREREGWHVFESSGDDGRFSLRNAVPGLSVQLTVRMRYFTLTRFDGTLPKDGELELRVAADDLPSVHLRGRIVDDANRAVPMAEVAVVKRGHGSSPVFRSGDEGRFAAGPFPAGEYRLSVRAAGRARTLTDWFQTRPGETFDAGTIRLEPGGIVEVQLFASSPLPERLYFPVDRADGTRAGHATIVAGRGSLANLAAGRYELQVRGGNLALANHAFELEPGGKAVLHLTVAAGVATKVKLFSSRGALPKRARIELETADRRPLMRVTAIVRESGQVALGKVGLLPGAYRLGIAVDGRRVGQRNFTVDAGSGECLVEVPIPGH